jgi:AcrR family transcriptional regulator
MPVARKADRRVERTQQLIRSALRSLIQERGFEALTVQQIIDRANVGRATFYAHFDNKEDLLASGFDDLRASLKERQRDARARGKSVEEQVFAFSEQLFAHTDEYRDAFHTMVGKQSGAAVQRLVQKILVDLVRDDVKATLGRGERTAVPTEALVQFITGALVGLLMWWMEGTMRLSVADVNALFRKLAIPVLKTAAR